MDSLVNSEVGAALGKFFHGPSGPGPSHRTLTQVFRSAGFSGDDPYDPATGTPNKQTRVVQVCHAAERRPTSARRLVEELLTALRVHGCFATTPDVEGADPESTALLRAALNHLGWNLTEDGRLERQGEIDLKTGGRAALDEQLGRLRRNTEDPALLLGGAKDLLESIAKFTLVENDRLPERRVEFPELISLSFEQLGLLPTSVDMDAPGAKQVRSIYQSAKTIALSVNELRNLQGTGHGRTLPTGMSVDGAQFVIRQTAHLSELMLSTHDRMMGRG